MNGDKLYTVNDLNFAISDDIEELSNAFKFILEAGDKIRIETPLNSQGC